MFSDRLEALLPDLRAYAQMLCKDAVQADDIVQNACLKAWQSRGQFDPKKGALRGWLFRIVRNEFYQHARLNRRQKAQDEGLSEQELVTNCDLEPRSNLSRMLQAVESLRRAQRDAFLLVVAAGFTYEEAGEVLGCAPGTVKSRVSRARETALGRFHSEHWSADEVDLISAPIEKLHKALNRIQSISNAA